MRACALFGLLLLSGCATEGTSIPIGTGKHLAPTRVDEIALLVSAPAQAHEIIALVEGVASTDDYLSEKRTQDAALTAMRKEAARIGADAIVLTGKGSEPYAQISTGSGIATASGSAAFGTAYFSSAGTTMGWQKIRISGTAISFKK